MEIIQHNTEKAGNFKAINDGVTAGLMTYTWAGKDKFIIDFLVCILFIDFAYSYI